MSTAIDSLLLVGCSFFAGGESRLDDQSMRVHVGPGGPADVAGIKDGDRIVQATAKAQSHGIGKAVKLVSMLVCYFLPYIIAISIGLGIASTRRRRASA